jgi:5-methylthioadenosine/S-adenosylhomocysteine deaminase
LGIILRNIVTGAEKEAKVIQLRIEGETISAISEEELPLRADDTVIDGGEKLVLPGFVNAHTHLPMVLFRGLADDLLLRVWLEEHIWPIEKDLHPEEVYWGALFGLAEMIRGGTTTCADMYFHTDAIGRAVEEVGVRALLSCGIIAERLDAHGKRELKKAEEAQSGTRRSTSRESTRFPFTRTWRNRQRRQSGARRIWGCALFPLSIGSAPFRIRHWSRTVCGSMRQT